VDTIEAIHTRRTIRVFRPEPVARALLEQVLWAAVQAPTPPVSGASATWRLCVIEGAERLAAYGGRAKQHAFEHQPPGQRRGRTERPDFKVFWNAPAAPRDPLLQRAVTRPCR
jgi:nitroreductase